MYIYLCEYLNGNHRKNNNSKSFSDLRQSKDFPFINHRPPPSPPTPNFSLAKPEAIFCELPPGYWSNGLGFEGGGGGGYNIGHCNIVETFIN